MEAKIEKRSPPTSVNDYLAAMGDTLAVLAWCWREFVNARSRAWMRRAIALSFGSRLVSLAYPFLMGVGIDGLIRHDGTLAILAVVGTGVTYLMGSLTEWRMGRNIELALGENLRTLERRINELFFEKELGLHLEEGSQLTQANMEKGYNRFHSAQQSLLFGGMDAVMTLCVTWTMLLLISPPSAGIVLCAICASLVVSLHLNRFVVAGMDPIDERFRKLHRRRAERWEGVERVVTSGRDAAEVTEMDAEFEQTIEDERRVWLPYLRGTVLRSTLNGLAVTTVGFFAGLRVWNGDMTMADLVPVLTWSGMASQQMRFIARVEREVNWCTPSLRSLREALMLPVRVTDAPDAVDLSPGAVRLELRDVCFRYAHARSSPDGAARQVLRGITFTVEPGEKVALIGPSGSGKSTLARLLQRYWDPDAGAILVNGVDLRRVRLRAWREASASILQRAHVFDGTLRSNLTYALDRERLSALSDEQIWEHMRLLRVDFGSRLHQGLDTPVGHHGLKLSGGEAQRVMIGAAALKHPRLMIIDEATSSLDAENQAAVQDGLHRLLAGESSAIIIAHRLSTILACDKFVVLRPVEGLVDGESQIEAIASTPEELYACSPTFRRLADLEGVRFLHAQPSLPAC